MPYEPNDISSRLNTLIAKGHFIAAIELANESIERINDIRIIRIRSGALASIGKYREAFADALECIEYDAENTDYIIHLASIEIEIGNTQSAIKRLLEVISKDTDGTISRMLSGAFSQIGEYKKAQHYAVKSIELSPNNSEFVTHAHSLSNHQASNFIIPSKKNILNKKNTNNKNYKKTNSAINQARVIYALLLREIAGQYQNSKLGYLWALIEPLTHIMVLGFFFSLLNHTTPPLGHNLYLFYLTGLLPFFMVIHTCSKLMDGLKANRSLLLLPPVTLLDILFARAILSYLTEITVGFLILNIFNWIGINAHPADALQMLFAMTGAWFFGLGLGTFMAIISEIFETWEMIWAQITKALYFTSGIFYIAEKTPKFARDYLIWNPILQSIEWLRSGFYDGFSPPWINISYLLILSSSLFITGVCLINILNSHIRIEE